MFVFCPFLRLFYLFIHFQTFSYFSSFFRFRWKKPISSRKPSQFPSSNEHVNSNTIVKYWYSVHFCCCWCAILIAHQIVMAKHGGSCVHFSGISTCGRTSRETVSHSQRQPLPTPHKIALPVYVTVTNKRLQPLTTTLYNSLVLSFSLLTTKRRLIKHRSFLRVLRSS